MIWHTIMRDMRRESDGWIEDIKSLSFLLNCQSIKIFYGVLEYDTICYA